ncbi:PucR family transcriptional regulator [Nocardioides sp. Kera G14]|uniref:PucR family transcriptional regulator n=1 Tax=Nocardioides sp. Kera G14 TaxID=2884264 RepID=UPI001D121167|nr:helix-turn-helix domain-containing protein [Nocardioides sp. Kera G14]UDY23709.1 helix-turn-helix domain-containing protein [Nocardioides sp. Kera G14]
METERGTAAELEAWVGGFIMSERSDDRVAAWVDRTWRAIAVEVPAVAADADLAGLVRRAIDQHWRAFLDHLAGEASFRLVPAAVELAHELARRHLDLTLLLGIYRAAQRSSWVYATEVVRDAPVGLDHEGILVLFWTEAATWLDASVEESLLLHQHEAARIQQRGDAQRFEAVQALLGGTDRLERGPRELSAALGGYPVTESHVAVVLTALTPEALALLEPTAHRVASRLGRRAPLIVRPSGREAWCWVPADHLADLGSLGLDPVQLRISMAGPHPGIEGFVLAHQEAQAARSVALARSATVTTYDDVAVLTMLAADPEAAERFTRRVLGPLLDVRHDQLRDTVRAALTHAGDSTSLAEALGVHKNTVRYRLQQAERLLGQPIRPKARDLLLALDYADAFLRSQGSPAQDGQSVMSS